MNECIERPEILGNHDEMMLGAREGRSDFQYFLKFDGQSTLDSYGVTNIHSIPRAHFEFLESSCGRSLAIGAGIGAEIGEFNTATTHQKS